MLLITDLDIQTQPRAMLDERPAWDESLVGYLRS